MGEEPIVSRKKGNCASCMSFKKDKRKFVFFTSLPTVGGHTTISISLTKLLYDYFDQVLVVSREMPGHGTSLEAITELNELGAKTLILGRNGIRQDILQIAAYTKREWRKPDVFLAMGMRHLSPVFSLILRPKKSIYYHITHELTPNIRRMLRLYSFFFSELAFISPATEVIWSTHINSIPTRCITQPIGIIESNPATRSTIGPIRFGFLGRLNQAKGCDLIADFAKFSNSACELRIAGSGDFAAKFLELSKNQDQAVKVRFDGEFTSGQRVEYLKDFFNEIDFLIVPSQDDREGIPTVILEALSAGVPVIATRTGGIVAFEKSTFGFVPDGPVQLVDKTEFRSALELFAQKSKPSPMTREACKEYFAKYFSNHAILLQWKKALEIH